MQMCIMFGSGEYFVFLFVRKRDGVFYHSYLFRVISSLCTVMTVSSFHRGALTHFSVEEAKHSDLLT